MYLVYFEIPYPGKIRLFQHIYCRMVENNGANRKQIISIAIYIVGPQPVVQVLLSRDATAMKYIKLQIEKIRTDDEVLGSISNSLINLIMNHYRLAIPVQDERQSCRLSNQQKPQRKL